MGFHFSIPKSSSSLYLYFSTCTKKGVGSYIVSASHRVLLVPLATFWSAFQTIAFLCSKDELREEMTISC